MEKLTKIFLLFISLIFIFVGVIGEGNKFVKNRTSFICSACIGID